MITCWLKLAVFLFQFNSILASSLPTSTSSAEKLIREMPPIAVGLSVYYLIVAAILIVCLIVLLMAYLYRYVKKYRKKFCIKTPLAMLLSELVVVRTEIKSCHCYEFASQLATALKKYIFVKYKISVYGRTTEECLQCLKNSSYNDPDILYLFSEVFNPLDSMKFAGESFSVPELERIFVQSCTLLRLFVKRKIAIKKGVSNSPR